MQTVYDVVSLTNIAKSQEITCNNILTTILSIFDLTAKLHFVI